MANLKDIRTRINSVKTTKQVTNAMKMVSAAKLKKAQDEMTNIRYFTSKLAGIIHDLNFSSDNQISCVYTEANKGKKVAIIVIASNRGLCGAFNSNIVKAVQSLINTKFQNENNQENIDIYVIGKQVEKMLKMRGVKTQYEYNDLIHTPKYDKTKILAKKILDSYASGQYNKVIVIYNEFVNAAVQNVQSYQFLPFLIPKEGEASRESMQYVLEPDINRIIYSLIPEMLQSMLFQVLLESQASEHGARMTSMHKATDNANELINDLQLAYNKARQSAITNEIIEVTGGANALRG